MAHRDGASLTARTARPRSGRRTADRLDRATLEDAFIALTDGVVIADDAGVILSANPAAFRLLGEDELLGRTFAELLLVSGATTIQRVDGHTVRRAWFPREERMGVLELVSTPLRGEAVTGGTIHTIRDVTAQAELLRLKEDFLLEVAHELRTPIAALSASLDLLHQDALTMPRDELAMMTATVRRSAYRLEHLVENLLEAGSIEAGTFQVRVLPMSLRHALDDALQFVRPLLDAKRQELVTRIAPGVDRVAGDPRRTAQVFSNLLGNASRYSPEGTRIALDADAAANEGFIRVAIADAGPGIAADEQPRLFQRFFRSREVRSEAGGLGLGLTICRAIVQAQGGEIGITSELGSGTSVHFTLPRARELAEEADSA
ncbi:MAG: sensor histidine kinase [Candidatus Limnocylindria bacterium]